MKPPRRRMRVEMTGLFPLSKLDWVVKNILGPAFMITDEEKTRAVVEEAVRLLEQEAKTKVDEKYASLLRRYYLEESIDYKDCFVPLRKARLRLAEAIDKEALAKSCFFVGDIEIPKKDLTSFEVARLLFRGKIEDVYNFINLIRRGNRRRVLLPKKVGKSFVFSEEVLRSWQNYLIRRSRWVKRRLAERLLNSK